MPFTINLWAMVAGELAACGVVFAIWFWRRRQRRLRKERPPVKTKLLRPPGHTLSIQLQDKEEKLLWCVMILTGCAAGVALMFSVMVAPFLRPEVQLAVAQKGGLGAVLSHRSVLPAALVAGFSMLGLFCGSAYGLVSAMRIEKELRSLYLGLRGEQAVAEKLVELAADGYRSFHDFPGDDWNIDHIIVGPAGVFVIETKTRSKRKAPPKKRDHVVEYDGVTLQFPWDWNRDYVEQAKRNAKHIAAFLNKSTGMKIWVNPMLVLPGWFVEPTTNPLEHLVRAMPETALVEHMRGLRRSLSDQQIQQIAFQLEQKCRDVEF